jgi:hypothetical protein
MVCYQSPLAGVSQVMKTILFAAVMTMMAANAWADGPSCSAQSTDKHLSGAAKTSFMKKCTTDSTAACDSTAVEKHLAGAAKTSFTRKCVKDAVG